MSSKLIGKNSMSQEKNIYILSDKKVANTINLPMIEISYLPFEIDFSQYEALVFTSRNAIKSINSFSNGWKKIPSYVIAPQTAKTLEKLGGTLQYVGENGHGNDFAKEIECQLQGKKVLYLCGKKVVSNLFGILNESGVLCEKAVVYETICKEYAQKLTLPKNSIIIFSSPSTLECFFKNISSWDTSYTAISIGKTTAQYFPKNITPLIPNQTSLDACVEIALGI